MPIDPRKLEIVLYPDPILRRKAKTIDQVTDEVRAVAVRMFDLMRQARGVGLAAPQVGLAWRMFVANPTGEADDDKVFINPMLRDPDKELEDYEEGCLSLPEVRADIRRPRAITIEATDLQGQRFTLTADDLPARVWQHETDHLDGVLILDRMTPTDRMANRRLIREMEKAAKKKGR